MSANLIASANSTTVKSSSNITIENSQKTQSTRHEGRKITVLSSHFLSCSSMLKNTGSRIINCLKTKMICFKKNQLEKDDVTDSLHYEGIEKSPKTPPEGIVSSPTQKERSEVNTVKVEGKKSENALLLTVEQMKKNLKTLFENDNENSHFVANELNSILCIDIFPYNLYAAEGGYSVERLSKAIKETFKKVYELLCKNKNSFSTKEKDQIDQYLRKFINVNNYQKDNTVSKEMYELATKISNLTVKRGSPTQVLKVNLE